MPKTIKAQVTVMTGSLLEVPSNCFALYLPKIAMMDHKSSAAVFVCVVTPRFYLRDEIFHFHNNRGVLMTNSQNFRRLKMFRE